MKCETHNCDDAATSTVYWPGRTTLMCARCALRALNTATAMGFKLSIKPLDVPPLEEPTLTHAGNLNDVLQQVPCSGKESACRNCDCTDELPCLVDQQNNLVDVADGTETLPDGVSPCYWVQPGLCSACVVNPPPPLMRGPDGRPLRGAL